MITRAVQQFQLRTVIGSHRKAGETLRLVKEAEYDGIELNGFMIRKMPLIVRILTRLAGMPIGKSGRLDWHSLVSEAGLKVVSIHEDLRSILRDPDKVTAEAESFDTDCVVVTGMHHFDYGDINALLELTEKLNKAGKLLRNKGIRFFYHNHNCEFIRLNEDQTAFDIILEETDSRFVNFELDAYWATDGGVDVPSLMDRMGDRLRLLHISDRGFRKRGKKGSILKFHSMELGYGAMNLPLIAEKAIKANIEAVVLETHKDWAEGSPVKSFQLSADFINRNF